MAREFYPLNRWTLANIVFQAWISGIAIARWWLLDSPSELIFGIVFGILPILVIVITILDWFVERGEAETDLGE